MPSTKQKMESMLFDYETTYRTAYRGGPLQGLVKTEYQEKKSRTTRPAPLSKDTHTLTLWKTTIPFYLLHKPKDIVRTNPYIVQQPYERPEDIDREKVQKSRPRLVMTPAVSMDDIEEEHARDILCRDMYTSDMTRRLREAVGPSMNIRAPFPGLPASSNPIVLPKLQPPAVPPEWRMETAAWDGKQLRSYCDPTRDFWLRQQVPKCRACAESATIKSHRKMLRQMKR